MKRLILTTIILVMPITATSEQETLGIRGMGNLSCGEFISVLEENNVTAECQFRSWVDGYISGINFQDAVKETRAHTTETEVIEQWLVNRCKQNPFELFANATLQLVEELEE